MRVPFANRNQRFYHFPVGRFTQAERLARLAKLFVALLCIVCVLALCIAPYVDIPVTAMKSLQMALLLMLALAGSAILLPHRLLFSWVVLHPGGAMPGSFDAPSRRLLLPLETNCVQRW